MDRLLRGIAFFFFGGLRVGAAQHSQRYAVAELADHSLAVELIRFEQ